jgi:DNA ligase-1
MEQLQKMVNELLTTNSSNEKMAILAKYPENKEYLKMIYSDFVQFRVTSKNIVKTKTKCLLARPINCRTLMEVIDVLSRGLVTGHDALKTVHLFIDNNPQYEDLILSALDKNLKCRVDTKMINKVFENLIPTFNVALAKDYNKLTKKPDLVFERYLFSRKLDGCRAVVIKRGNSVTCFSRTGKEFETLEVLKQEILNLDSEEDFVFDGELCLVNNGIEDFQGVMQEIRRKDHTIQNPKYKIFDMLTIEEFENGSSKRTLMERLLHLQNTIDSNDYNGEILEILNQGIIESEARLLILLDQAVEKGWEGIMLRKDCPYEGKRTNNLLKLKKFFDDEYVVTDIEIEKMRFCKDDPETGAKVEVEEEVMARANILHKGFKVGVGSGWSIQQRRDFKEDPSKIVGKTINVRYFAESTNQEGGISLRFPTVQYIYGDKRDE